MAEPVTIKLEVDEDLLLEPIIKQEDVDEHFLLPPNIKEEVTDFDLNTISSDSTPVLEDFDVKIKPEVILPTDPTSDEYKPSYSDPNWQPELQPGYNNSQEPVWSHFAVYLEEVSEYNATKSGEGYVEVIQTKVTKKIPSTSAAHKAKVKAKQSSSSHPLRPLRPIPSDFTAEEAAALERRRANWRAAFRRRIERKKEKKAQEEALKAKTEQQKERKREIWRASYQRRKEMLAAKRRANYNSDPVLAERRRQQWRASYKRRMDAKRAAMEEEEQKRKPSTSSSSSKSNKARQPERKAPVKTKKVATPSKKKQTSAPPRKSSTPVRKSERQRDNPTPNYIEP